MAVGKQISSFKLKSTSITLSASGERVTTAEVNFEGEITGEFASFVLATMSVASRDGHDGTYKVCARCFLGDGSVVDAVGEGRTSSAGGRKWTVAGTGEMGGRSIAVQGEIDLADRSYTGKLFERN